MLCPVNVSLHTMQTKHGIQCSGVSYKVLTDRELV